MTFFFSRFNWVKTLQVTAALTVSAVVLGSFALDLWTKRRIAYFESAFSEAMKRPVTIGGAGFDPLVGFYFENFAVKELKTAPRPLSIGRLEAKACLLLWPEPAIRVRKLVLVRPNISIDVHPEDLFRSQLWLKRVPLLETRIGRLKFEAKLDAVEAYDGRVSIFSRAARQDFEAVRFFAGKRWPAPQVLTFEGRVAGKPEARFKIDCRIRPSASGELQSEARADFRHFTTAYMKPFLAGRFELPDRHLTGSLRVSVGEKGLVSVQGRLALPESRSRTWAVWEPKPDRKSVV